MGEHHILTQVRVARYWRSLLSWRRALRAGHIPNIPFYTVSQKTVQNCFWQNFVKCSPILIIFGRMMENRLALCMVYSFSTSPTPCPKKTKQICFCQNLVKFAPILIIFGRKLGNDPSICEVHAFSTSPNLRHHLTVLNTNVPNCYITPKLLVIDRSHWRPQFNRGRRTFRDHSNFRQFVHIW